MTKKAESEADLELPTEIIVPTDWAEAMFAKGKLNLSPEQIEQLEGNETISLPIELVDALDPPKVKKSPRVWIEPIDAVHWLAPRLGGDPNAKSVIAERLRDGAIECTHVWLSEGPDIGPLTNRRPVVSDDPQIENHARWVSKIERKGGPVILGGIFWRYSDDWERDVKRWNWADGLFVASRRSTHPEIGSRAQANDQLSQAYDRMVVSGIRFNQADIEAIVQPGCAPFHNSVEALGKEVEGVRNKTGKPGRKRNPEWDNWVAEVVILSHTDGIDLSMSGEDFHDLIADRLSARKVTSPEWTTVEKTVPAIMNRWREAKNSREF